MNRADETTRPTILRPAGPGDVDVVAGIWHRGWPDGHRGHVPDALVEVRRHLDDFRPLVAARLDRTTVAVAGPVTVGFVMVHDDEIEHIYVVEFARGRGVADALLAHGEAVVGARYDRAWLAVVAGNSRARRFYERRGWSDAGPYDNPAPVADGRIVSVPTRRYEKPVGD
jgi:GNAT superfamily N-acetyltransferase